MSLLNYLERNFEPQNPNLQGFSVLIFGFLLDRE